MCRVCLGKKKSSIGNLRALVIHGYRYYSVELGRWISRDPVGENNDINLFDTSIPELNYYHMVLNNTLYYVDPLGLYQYNGANPPDLKEAEQKKLEREKKRGSSCKKGFCVIGSEIEDKLGEVVLYLGIEHVDISYNGVIEYVGARGGAGRAYRKVKENNSMYPLSIAKTGTLLYGKKKNQCCSALKEAEKDDDILDCLKNHKQKSNVNCQGDVKNAVKSCCLKGFNSFVSKFFYWVIP